MEWVFDIALKLGAQNVLTQTGDLPEMPTQAWLVGSRIRVKDSATRVKDCIE
jgi:hypothetical protein